MPHALNCLPKYILPGPKIISKGILLLEIPQYPLISDLLELIYSTAFPQHFPNSSCADAILEGMHSVFIVVVAKRIARGVYNVSLA